MLLKTLAKDIINGYSITGSEALELLNTPDDELLALLDAAFMLRRHYFGYDVTVHVIKNARSGLCTEDCAFCSQSASAETDIPHYPLLTPGEILEEAREAFKMKAFRYCIVTSGSGPSDGDIDALCDAVRRIKQEIPIRICTSLGMLNISQALRLKEAGVGRFNHNLETSERFYPSICSSHSYKDRINTARTVKQAGLELCCGGLIGMGETHEDRVDLAFSLRDVNADSIPLNFLDPRPGTRLEKLTRLTPQECLKALAMFRFVNPDREIRAAGGREACLGSMQVLSLYAANSIFTRGYLTTPGQGFSEDAEMIRNAGFRIAEITSA
jgi:biotin synthase